MTMTNPPIHNIIFILGGPASGKGTICDFLIKNYGYIHISCGELIRNFMKENPTHERTLKYLQIFKEGNTIPATESFQFMKEYTNDFYKNVTDTQLNIVIDGYPRTLDELTVYNTFSPRPFEGKHIFLIHVNVPDNIMTERMIKRCRDFADQDSEIVKKRINHYHNKVLPVVDHIIQHMFSQYLEVSGQDDPESNAKTINNFIQMRLC